MTAIGNVNPSGSFQRRQHQLTTIRCWPKARLTGTSDITNFGAEASGSHISTFPGLQYNPFQFHTARETDCDPDYGRRISHINQPLDKVTNGTSYATLGLP
jgi:hypothetical protein